MVDETETPRVLEELSRSNAAPIRTRSERQRRTIKRVAVIVLMLSPLLLGVVLLAYQQWTLRGRLIQVFNENSSLLDTIESNYTRIAQLEDAVDQAVPDDRLDQVRREFSTALEQLQAELGELRATLQGSLDQQAGSWQLVQAEHLLRLANQQLQLSGDAPSSLSMLEAADRALAASGDPGIVPVRQALARDMDALRSVGTLDTEGLYLRIGKLKQSIAQLPVAVAMQEAYRERLGRQDDGDSTGEGTNLDSGLDFLRSVFVWRKWEDTPEVMHPPQEAASVRQSVLLILEQSQLALLARQPAVYRDSLQQARNLVGRYLVDLGREVPRLLDELDVLLAVELSPRQPDISASLRLLESRMAGSATGGTR